MRVTAAGYAAGGGPAPAADRRTGGPRRSPEATARTIRLLRAHGTMLATSPRVRGGARCSLIRRVARRLNERSTWSIGPPSGSPDG